MSDYYIRLYDFHVRDTIINILMANLDIADIYDITNNIIKASLYTDFISSNPVDFNINNVLAINQKILEPQTYNKLIDSIEKIVIEIMENYFDIEQKLNLIYVAEQFKNIYIKKIENREKFLIIVKNYITDFLLEYKDIKINNIANANKLDIINYLREILKKILEINPEDGNLKTALYNEKETEYQSKLNDINIEFYRCLGIKPNARFLKASENDKNITCVMSNILLFIKKNLYAPLVESKFELLYPYSFGINVDILCNGLKANNNVTKLETFVFAQATKSTSNNFSLMASPYLDNNQFVTDLAFLGNIYNAIVSRESLHVSKGVYFKIYQVQSSIIKSMINTKTSTNRKFDIVPYIIYAYLHNVKNIDILLSDANDFFMSVKMSKGNDDSILNADNFYNISKNDNYHGNRCISTYKELFQEKLYETNYYYNTIRSIWNICKI